MRSAGDSTGCAEGVRFPETAQECAMQPNKVISMSTQERSGSRTRSRTKAPSTDYSHALSRVHWISFQFEAASCDCRKPTDTHEAILSTTRVLPETGEPWDDNEMRLVTRLVAVLGLLVALIGAPMHFAAASVPLSAPPMMIPPLPAADRSRRTRRRLLDHGHAHAHVGAVPAPQLPGSLPPATLGSAVSRGARVSRRRGW